MCLYFFTFNNIANYEILLCRKLLLQSFNGNTVDYMGHFVEGVKKIDSCSLKIGEYKRKRVSIAHWSASTAVTLLALLLAK